MTDEVKTSEYTYRLRASSPMPLGNGAFLLQGFGGEYAETINYVYTEYLPRSEDFRGNDHIGNTGTYISANFSRIQDKNAESFQGKVNDDYEFIDEEFITPL